MKLKGKLSVCVGGKVGWWGRTLCLFIIFANYVRTLKHKNGEQGEINNDCKVIHVCK